jgi:ADP-ribosylglycohydrolase/8-oxo-dGTP pyrophosphatase MutT (NUDIX family)
MSLPEIRTRDSARVLVIDRAGRLLLLKYRAPANAAFDDEVWLTPGGGLEDGETLVIAAARELSEETGIAVPPDELGNVVATRTGTWCVPDGTVAFRGANHYFMVRTDVTELDLSGHTPWERDLILDHRWWTADELRTTTEWIDTPRLADLLERLLDGDVPSKPVVLPWSSATNRVRASILAGAIGDAIGSAVEFSSLASIVSEFGPDGVRTMASHLITDDTQMTLFTAQGLLEADPGAEASAVLTSYLDWLGTQSRHEPPAGVTGLATERWLYARRAPGNACLSGLQNYDGGPVNRNSKGCGTVMRSAPFGLLGLGAERAFDLSASCARFTHGHPTAAAAAGSFAAIVDELASGTALSAAIELALELLASTNGGDETREALLAAVRLAQTGGAPSPSKVESLGQGWVAEEALAIAVYCALVAEHLLDGVLLAVNHSGDSDSTGSICGNLLGAERGLHEIPPPWIHRLEGVETIKAVADRLASRRHANVHRANHR